MSDRAPAKRTERPPIPTGNSGISPEVDEQLRERTAIFQKATQRRGAPMTYGAKKKDK